MELKASEARYRLLADHITDMIVQVDLDSTRLYVSPSSKEVLGYEPEELIGTTPFDELDLIEERETRAFHQQMESGSLENRISHRQ